MSTTLTLILLAACVALVVFAGWRGALPPNPARGPRMIPWRFVMILAIAALIFLLVHLVWTLTGRTAAPF